MTRFARSRRWPGIKAAAVACVCLVTATALASCNGAKTKAHPAAPAHPSTSSSGAPSSPSTQAATSTSSSPSSSTSASPANPCGGVAPPPLRYRHVVWIWMENHDRQQVLGNPAAAKYEVGLARQCGTATRYSTVGSPSLPNYVGATSGNTWGIDDDSGPSAHPLTVDNVFHQVRAAGGTERSYEEAMTSPCQLTPGGNYAVKHNPAAYYTGAGDRAACGTDDVGLAALTGDLAANSLPTLGFVTPDLCDDTHDCPVATGDAWLALWVPQILASPAYRDGTTAVFVVWDEYTPTPNLIVAPTVPTGATLSVPVDHYALLRTTEEMLGLPLLARAASAKSLRSAFRL